MGETTDRKVEFQFHTHYRVHDLMSCSKTNPKGTLPRGGVTIAVIKYKGESNMRIGVMPCSKTDMFCKNDGKNKAFDVCNNPTKAIFFPSTKSINIIRNLSNHLAGITFKQNKLDIIKSNHTIKEMERAVKFLIVKTQYKKLEKAVSKSLQFKL